MIKHFLYVWGAYWTAVILLPVSSVYPEVFSALVLQLFFVFFVLLGYSWMWMASRDAHLPVWGEYSHLNLRWMIRVSLFLSLIGTFFLFYDKSAIQGIDYSQGIAVAREAWRKEGVARDGGISSIFSVLGYLLSSGYFVAAVLLVVGGSNLSRAMRYKVVLAIFALLMLNSILAGGRSNVLLLAVFVIGAISSVTGWSFKALFENKLLRTGVMLLLVAAFSYLLYVFSKRAEATGITAFDYVQHFVPYLGLEISPWFNDFSGAGLFSSISGLLVLAASYISHSFATTAAIIDHGVGDKIIVFLHPMNILYKLQLVERPDSSWFLAGRFPSLPGALFYQFGAFGFMVISILIGFLSGLAKFFYLCRPGSLLLLSFYLMMYVVLVISPILLAVDFMSFPFVLWSFVVICFCRGAVSFLRMVASR